MRQAQRRVAHLARLFAEYSAEQTLLGGKLGLALRRDLADEYVAGANLGTLSDDTVGSQILERVLADVRDFAGYLLRSELGVARFVRVFLNVNRRVYVVAHKAFI